jgi:hypothetical protein
MLRHAPPVRSKSLALIWAFAFAGCFAMTGFATSAGINARYLAWLLWPGVALYAVFNGSLLFGGGFGDVGNFLIITVASAFAWSLLVAAAVVLAVRLGRSP